MLRLTSFCCLLLVLLAAPTHAAVIQGRVTDPAARPLPFAVVFVAGTTTGTTANADGQYSLELPAGTYRIGCQYMGYQQQVTSVTVAAAPVRYDIVLQEQKLDLKEVTVRATDEDPAYRYIRNAIAKRETHLQQVQNFQSRIYLKGVLRSRTLGDRVFGKKLSEKDRDEMNGAMGLDSTGKGIVYLCEEVADYYAKGGDERTVIRSVRESGEASGFGVAQMPPVLSLYESNPRPFGSIAPRGFISPIADAALEHYRYKLLGEFQAEGRTVFKIAVQPRREFEPCLTGTIYVVEGDWALYSVDVYATRRSGIQLLDTLSLRQVFLPVRPDVWVVKSQVLQPAIALLGFNVVGSFVSVYDDQRVNEPLPDSLFHSKVLASYAPDATTRDSAYWSRMRPVPLEGDEIRDYHFKDSVRVVEEDPARRDSLRRIYNRISPIGLLLSGKRFRSAGERWGVDLSPLLLSVSFNAVEGWNAAPTVLVTRRLDTFSQLRFLLRPRYGFANERAQGLAALGYSRTARGWQGRSWSLSGTAGRYVYQYNEDAPVDPLLNTISALVFQENYLKLYERLEATLRFRQATGTGFSWGLTASLQDRRPLENTTDFSWRSEAGRGYAPNLPPELAGFPWEPHRAAVVDVSASYQPGITYIQYPRWKAPQSSSWPVFSVRYTKGIPGIAESKTDFDSWRAGVSGRRPLRRAGTFGWQVAAGGFLNDRYVALPDLMHLRGNQYPLASPYLESFQMAPYYRYSNAEQLYGELHAEHNFQGWGTNRIPGLKHAQLHLIAGTNSFYARTDFWYAEAFVGLGNIGIRGLRFLRVDVVQSWDPTGPRDLGVRIGLSGIHLSQGTTAL